MEPGRFTATHHNENLELPPESDDLLLLASDAYELGPEYLELSVKARKKYKIPISTISSSLYRNALRAVNREQS